MAAAIDQVPALRAAAAGARCSPACASATPRSGRPRCPSAPLLSLTRAIEDEYCARGDQRPAGRLLSARALLPPRRAPLARAGPHAPSWPSRWPTSPSSASPPALRSRCRSPADQPLAREWTLVIDAPGAQACLAAWEQPTQERAARSPRDASRCCGRLSPASCARPARWRSMSCGASRPTVADRAPARPVASRVAPPPELRFASALAHRMVGYLAGRSTVGRPPAAGPSASARSSRVAELGGGGQLAPTRDSAAQSSPRTTAIAAAMLQAGHAPPSAATRNRASGGHRHFAGLRSPAMRQRKPATPSR